MYLGAHIGISGGIEHAPEVARSIGCDAMQLFSKNQRQWRVPDLDPAVAKAFQAAVKKEGIRATAIHCAYLINLGSQEHPLQERSREGLQNEIERAGALGVPYVILHPGAHKGAGVEQGLATIADGARQALGATEGTHVRLLLENSAGGGSTLGQTFEEIAELYRLIGMKDRVGCCIDTCHAFATGLDFRTEKQYEALIDRVESTIGLSSVYFFHLNDAMFELGSHRDRHANIGAGHIGKEGFRWLVNDARLAQKAGALETPLEGDEDRPYRAYQEDLLTLRSLIAAKPSKGARTR